jgi:hypothetical protein
VLRRIFGLKRGEVREGWTILHIEEIYNLNSLPNIIIVMKLRGMKWADHTAHMGKTEIYKKFGRKT